MTDLLIVGDTERCMELRHELPLRIGDPFLYAEIGERRVAVVWSIEGDRIAAIDPSVEIVPSETISVDDLIAAGVDYYEIDPAQTVRSVRALGITRARVPFAFPVRIADALRAAAEDAFAARGCRSDDAIVAHGAQAADGHHQGEGQLANDDVVVCDLFPLDLESACYSDMTRTYSVGTPDPELVTWHAHTREALEHVRSLLEPGADGPELYRTVCRFYEDLGYPTRLSAEEGTVLREGFNHGLGHGVGLDVHEAPGLSRKGHELIAGDVITLEPGLYRHGFGGVRLLSLIHI